jgi:hypothetical protein
MQEDSRAGLAILLRVICIILSVCVFFNGDGFGSGVPEGLLMKHVMLFLLFTTSCLSAQVFAEAT